MSDTIRAARLLDLSALEVHQLYKLRVDVFVHEQQAPYAEIDDTDAERTTWHILATHGGEIVGTARIFPGEGEVWFGRFALRPDMRGTGMARRIMGEALERAAALWPGQDMVLHAQAPLAGYYGTYGFVPEGPEFDDTGVPHQTMRLDAAKLSG